MCGGGCLGPGARGEGQGGGGGGGSGVAPHLLSESQTEPGCDVVARARVVGLVALLAPSPPLPTYCRRLLQSAKFSFAGVVCFLLLMWLLLTNTQVKTIINFIKPRVQFSFMAHDTMAGKRFILMKLNEPVITIHSSCQAKQATTQCYSGLLRR